MSTVSSGQTQNVYPGQTVNNTTVLSGGVQEIFVGGVAVATTLSSGALQFDAGSASGTRIEAGGVDYVESFAAATDTIVSSGGVLVAFTDASLGSVTVRAGGIELLASVSSGITDDDSGYALSAAFAQTVFAGGTVLSAAFRASPTKAVPSQRRS
jgi:autotransporter passenger strand-loop-strand repeat protein